MYKSSFHDYSDEYKTRINGHATENAVIFEKNNDPLVFKAIPIPKPKPNEVLIRIKYSGICHTDLHAWHGDWPLDTKPNLVGGHEGIGQVVARGESVQNFEIGDWAGVKWLNGSCQSCEFCIRGFESNCAKADLSGYTHDGSFQQYCTADAVQAAKIPFPTGKAALKDAAAEKKYLIELAPILCAGVTVYKAIKTADLRAGEWLAVSGAGGGLGSIAVEYATAMGLRVIGIDAYDREDFVLGVGAEAFVAFNKPGVDGSKPSFKSKDELVQEVIKKTDGGAHGVINVSAATAAISQSFEYVRTCGTSVLVGLPAGAVAQASVFDAVVKSISIKGSYVGNRADTEEAIDFFARGKVNPTVKLCGLADLPVVFDKMAKGQIQGRYVIDTDKVKLFDEDLKALPEAEVSAAVAAVGAQEKANLSSI